MSDKIVSLRGDAPADAGIVHADVVEELERMLERAKAGEIVAFGYFGVKPNRHIFHGWDGASRGYTFELIAGAATVQHRMLRVNVPDEELLSDSFED